MRIFCGKLSDPRSTRAWNLRQKQTLEKHKTQVPGERVLAAAEQEAGWKVQEGTEGKDVRCPLTPGRLPPKTRARS